MLKHAQVDKQKSRSQGRQIAATAGVAVVLAAGTGLLAGLSVRAWLVFGLVLGLVIWVGGAISGQVLLARLLDRAAGQEVLNYLRLLLWIIPWLYVPIGMVGVGCGIALLVVTGVPFAQPLVIVPLALYGLTAVAGAVFSAPGYVRLIRFAEIHGADDPRVRQRLLPLAWLNRVELTLVCGVGFVLAAALVDGPA
jgi:hypothetical protein